MGNILIIDDDPDIRELVNAHLSNAGHSVQEAKNGQDGVAQASNDHPDLIILDINMPVMDGTRVMQALRGDESTAKIPVIALSVMSTSDMRDDMYNFGCDAYVLKPIDFDVLLGQIKSLIPA